jgi:virginiamycin B lyase
MSRRTGRLLTATLAAGLVLSMGSAALAAPATRMLKQFRVPTANSLPRAITNGSDGNRWFTESDSNVNFAKIARITPAGAITEFTPSPANGCNQCGISDIAQGPGGILYITNNSDQLMRFNVNTLSFLSPVTIQTGTVPTSSVDNVAASATDVWVSDFTADVIWRYNISTGQFTTTSVLDPSDVAVDGAGNAWFTQAQVNPDGTSNIGRIDRVTGALTSTVVNPAAGDLAVSPIDGKVWFTARFPNFSTSTDAGVGYLDPAAGNSVSFFPVPNNGPAGIAAGNDGSIWFTQTFKGNAASITNAGVITEGKAVKGSGPEGITVAPITNDPWYTMLDANKIAALVSK